MSYLFLMSPHSGRFFEREREIHYVHWASKAYEDESMFMPEAHRERERERSTTSIGPARLIEDESVFMSEAHLEW